MLLPSAAGMMLVIFSEALGAGQTFADKHGYRLDSSQEMIALGLANLGSGRARRAGLRGKPVPVSGQRRRGRADRGIADHRRRAEPGHRLALTPLFTDLPEAVLAALIIHAVSHLMKAGEMRRFHQLVPREFWLAMLTLLAVIVLDVLPALILGVVSRCCC